LVKLDDVTLAVGYSAHAEIDPRKTGVTVTILRLLRARGDRPLAELAKLLAFLATPRTRRSTLPR